jgi:hypothetical protein
MFFFIAPLREKQFSQRRKEEKHKGAKGRRRLLLEDI